MNNVQTNDGKEDKKNRQTTRKQGRPRAGEQHHEARKRDRGRWHLTVRRCRPCGMVWLRGGDRCSSVRKPLRHPWRHTPPATPEPPRTTGSRIINLFKLCCMRIVLLCDFQNKCIFVQHLIDLEGLLIEFQQWLVGLVSSKSSANSVSN